MIGWTFEQWCVGLANASEDSENGSEVEEKDSDIPMTTSLCLRFLSELWELFFFFSVVELWEPWVDAVCAEVEDG